MTLQFEDVTVKATDTEITNVLIVFENWIVSLQLQIAGCDTLVEVHDRNAHWLKVCLWALNKFLQPIHSDLLPSTQNLDLRPRPLFLSR